MSAADFTWHDPFEAVGALSALRDAVVAEADSFEQEAASFERFREQAVAHSRGLLTTAVREAGQQAAQSRRAARALRRLGGQS